MNPLNKLKNEAKSIRLSEREKALMRANIFGTPSPIQVRKSPYVTASHYSMFSARFVTVMAAFLVVVLGSGTVYAAQGALPGDVLYSVKTSVAEPVRTALAFSNEAKLSVHTDIAEERLEEAQALAAEGRLSVEAAAEIEKSLEAHVEEVQSLAVEVQEENPDAADEATSALESAIAVNSVILATLGDESDDNDTKKNSHSMASKAQARFAYNYVRNVGGMGDSSESMALMAPGTVAEDPNTLMATQSTSADATISAKMATTPPQDNAPGQKTAVEQLEKRAERTISDVGTFFRKVSVSLGATSTARVELELDALNEQMSVGDSLEASGEYTAARELYLQVHKDASALAAFIRAEQKFNKKILNSLLNERFGVRSVDLRIEQNLEGEVRGTQTDDSDDHTNGSDDDEEKDEGKSKKGNDKDELDVDLKVDLGL